MSYSIKKIEFEEYFLIEITGSWPTNYSGEIVESLLDEIKSINVASLIIDISQMKSNPSITHDYYDAEKFAKSNVLIGKKVAVLDKMDRKDANDFFETTSNNRGLNFKFFYSDLKEALDWLK